MVYSDRLNTPALGTPLGGGGGPVHIVQMDYLSHRGSSPPPAPPPGLVLSF